MHEDDSLLVIKGDKLVYEHYLNGMSPNQLHQMMSVTESFAGLLGMMALEQCALAGKPQQRRRPRLPWRGTRTRARR